MKPCDIEVGLDQLLFLMAGACFIESDQLTLNTVSKLSAMPERLYSTYKIATTILGKS